MKSLSRGLVVFVSILLIIFSVSGCTKREEKKQQGEAITEAEENIIPLETYLNGKIRNIGQPYSDSTYLESVGEEFTLAPPKHIAKKLRPSCHIKFYNDKKKTAKLGNLEIREYTTYDEFLKGEFHKNYYMDSDSRARLFVSTRVGVWVGYNIKYSFSYYKNGVNIYTKHFYETRAMSPGTINDNPLRGLKNIDKSKNGLYILHIQVVNLEYGYYSTSYKYTAFQDYVYAFQIGAETKLFSNSKKGFDF